MKKTFSLVDERIKRPRLVDAIKGELKKYIKRELNKKLPTETSYRTFDCKVGADESSATEVSSREINKAIDTVEATGVDSIYVEILATVAERTKKAYEPREERDSSED